MFNLVTGPGSIVGDEIVKSDALKEAADWLDDYRGFWEAGFDRLDRRLQSDENRAANG